MRKKITSAYLDHSFSYWETQDSPQHSLCASICIVTKHCWLTDEPCGLKLEDEAQKQHHQSHHQHMRTEVKWEVQSIFHFKIEPPTNSSGEILSRIIHIFKIPLHFCYEYNDIKSNLLIHMRTKLLNLPRPCWGNAKQNVLQGLSSLPEKAAELSQL